MSRGRTRPAKRATHRVKFGEAPPEGRRRYPWEEIAEQLRKRPDEWAVVLEDIPAATAYKAKAGGVSAVHPSRGFEFTTEGNTRPESGTRMVAKLHMRYRPELDTRRAETNGERA